MEARHDQILTDFAKVLKKTLNLTYLLPHLLQKRLVTAEEDEQLRQANRSTLDKNDEFLRILKTKGSTAFSKFLEALYEENQHLGHEDLYDKLSQADKNWPFPNTRTNSSPSSSLQRVTGDADQDVNSSTSQQSETVSESRKSSPNVSRNNSTSSFGASTTGVSTASETRILNALEATEKRLHDRVQSVQDEVQDSTRKLTVRIDSLEKNVSVLMNRREVQPTSGYPSSSTLDSSSMSSRSRQSQYDADGSSTASTSEASFSVQSRKSSQATTLQAKSEGNIAEVDKARHHCTKPPRPSTTTGVSRNSGTNASFLLGSKEIVDNQGTATASSESFEYDTCHENLIDHHITVLNDLWHSDITVNTPCTCQQSQIPPIFDNSVVHFVYWESTATDGRMRVSAKVVREKLKSYNLTLCQWDSAGKEKMFTKFSSRKCVCSILMYKGKITLLADKESKRNALYFLEISSDLPNWKEILSSDFSDPVNPNNCLTVQYKDQLIILTYSPQSARHLRIYIYSPSKNDNKCWKSALLTPDIPSNAILQLQSCIAVNNHIYYSLKYGNQVHVYKTNLMEFSRAALVSSLESNIDQCFLSILNGNVVTFCKSNDKNASIVEVSPLQDTVPLHIQGKYSYNFSSSVMLVAVNIVHEGESGHKMVMVYHDHSSNQCILQTWKCIV